MGLRLHVVQYDCQGKEWDTLKLQMLQMQKQNMLAVIILTVHGSVL